MGIPIPLQKGVCVMLTLITTLNVVGYSDALSKDGSCWPCIVPPIYQMKENLEKIILPPFKLEGEYINGGVYDFYSLLEGWEQHGSCTQVPIRDALPNHTLWVDENGMVQYEPTDIVKEKLQQISQKNIKQAELALRMGDLKTANDCAQISCNANEGGIESIAIHIVVDKLQGDKRTAKFLQRMAFENGHSKEDLNKLIEKYQSMYKETYSEEDLNSIREKIEGV